MFDLNNIYILSANFGVAFN